MKFSLSRALIVARREYLSTIRRRAFLLTVLITPAYFAFVMYISIRGQSGEEVRAIKNLSSLGVVDSSGLFAAGAGTIRTEISADEDPLEMLRTKGPADTSRPAPRVFRAQVRMFPGQSAALAALHDHEVDQVIVVPADYLATGHLRRYAPTSNLFSSAAERPIERWMVRSLLAGSVDSLRIERAARPSRGMVLYTLSREGRFVLKDTRADLIDFMLPFLLGMLLSMCIVTGGQYLLQGVSEEKESRILEALLCTVAPEDLMVGKLIGLGGAALTLVGAWILMGGTASAPAARFAQIHFTVGLALIMFAYLLLGFLFYASVMTGIGAITNSMREAQQFALLFTFANFVPFIMMTVILGHPDGAVAVGMSMFPPTAPTTMMLRLTASGAAVPPWQIMTSLALLLATAIGTLFAAARVFRVGLLMYGKTPTLPEILKWVGQR
jgi:ABC-2 type transport system permease protein